MFTKLFKPQFIIFDFCWLKFKLKFISRIQNFQTKSKQNKKDKKDKEKDYKKKEVDL